MRHVLRAKAEKCACPLAAEGDSPIFAAAKPDFGGHVVSAAKIGTVPVNGEGDSPIFAAAKPDFGGHVVSAAKIGTVPVNGEGDSPIFAAAKPDFGGHVVSAAKIGTVPVNGYQFPNGGYRDSCFREIGKVRIGFFLLANAPVLTPEPEHVRADIKSVGPRDDPVIDECLGEETLVGKRLGHRAVHAFDMALEIQFGYQAVFVGEGDLEIAIGSHRFKSWSHYP